MSPARLIGTILIVGTIVTIFIARSNRARCEEIQRYVQAYQRENPVSSTLFGTPVSDAAQNDYRSALGFSYSFTPPLTAAEVGIYCIGITGILLVLFGGKKKPD